LLDHQISALDVAQPPKLLEEAGADRAFSLLSHRRLRIDERDAVDLAPPRLLRLRALRHKREQQAGEDLAAVHSITWSARASATATLPMKVTKSRRFMVAASSPRSF
jgi:hypothetical protein